MVMSFRGILTVLLTGVLSAVVACTPQIEPQNVASPINTELPIAEIPSTAPAIAPDSSIREIDFENFTYTGTFDGFNGTFHLRDGERVIEDKEVEVGVVLNQTAYADLTGDGQEEAILVMSLQTEGSGVFNLVYVYSLKKAEPKVLWQFMPGDRAEGGLKKVYAENGKFVVELYGDNRFENEKWDFRFGEKFSGYCCPTAYTRLRFFWNGSKFVLAGEPEVIAYDWNKKADAK